MTKMTLSEELTWRGFVNQTTFKDIKSVDGDSITFYWGVDPSADSMTIGHLSVALMIKRWIEHGHKAVLLVGGATGLIGDPDGKKQERSLKTVEEVSKNKAAIIQQYKNIFEGQDFTVVDNYDWFKDMGYMDFLRNVGKHLSMTQLLDREFVQRRIGKGGSGISYAEFSYSLIQGYDFLHLFKEKGVSLQICGADQWGNSLSGVEMIRKLEGSQAHVWSTPLVINKSTGVKFGKSEDGAIWLDSKKTSPFQFYQFWLNTDDEGVGEYLKIYTLIQAEEFEKLMNEFKKDPSQRAAQKYLAYEVTKLVHGEEKAKSAQKVTAALFDDTSIEELLGDDLEMLAQEIPTTNEDTLIEALVDSKVTESNSEARRLIEGNAVSVNAKKVTEDQPLKKPSLIKKGKNTFILVK